MIVSIHDGFAIIVTNELNVDLHSHSALQVTISLSDVELQCRLEHETIEGHIIVVPPLLHHAFRELTGPVAIILIDQDSAVATSIGMPREKLLEISDFKELRDYLQNKGSGQIKTKNLEEIFVQTEFFKQIVNSDIDKRIQKLIARIKLDGEFLPSAEEAAKICNLSVDRFLHLFKQELGLPFRKFLQWVKLRRSLKYLKSGCTLTEIAQIGGFFDSAHLSRFFKESFGITPTKVLQNSQFIQVE
jgi:AraC-like DNA-binding protein